MSEHNRRYERIEIELPCRLFIPGDGGLKFQAFCTSRNLGLGGIFVASSFLLKEDVELHVELGLPDGPLPIRSRIAHVVPIDDPKFTTGMGVEYVDVDAHGRETLLRYFTPVRYHRFYERFTEEFPSPIIPGPFGPARCSSAPTPSRIRWGSTCTARSPWRRTSAGASAGTSRSPREPPGATDGSDEDLRAAR